MGRGEEDFPTPTRVLALLLLLLFALVVSSPSPFVLCTPPMLRLSRAVRGVLCDSPGDVSTLRFTALPPQMLPSVTPTSVVIRVHAAGVNRADTLQRKGLYPPPPGETDVLGMEVAGVVVEVGDAVSQFQVGDRVMALLASGGYAEECVADYRQVLPIPEHWSFVHAAAIPEIFVTANEMLMEMGGLKSGQDVLIHAGASGVGSTAIQMALYTNSRHIFATCGSAEKCNALQDLVADFKQRNPSCESVFHCINYKEEKFEDIVTAAGGVDVVLDFIGAAYLQRNLQSLKPWGTLSVVGLMGGRSAELDLGLLLRKKLTVCGAVLRSRSPDEKAEAVQRFQTRWLPLLEQGIVSPLIDSTFVIEDAGAAHQHVEENKNIGKVLLLLPTEEDTEGKQEL